MPITAESVDLHARRMADPDTQAAGIDLAAYDALAGVPTRTGAAMSTEPEKEAVR